jgi:hypothetical protein
MRQTDKSFARSPIDGRAWRVRASKLEIMANADASDSARVSAACALLDRGWGKPRQTVDQNINDKRSETDWTRDELVAFLNNAAGRAPKTN